MMQNRKNLYTFFIGFADAFKGLTETLRTQFNMRFHLCATVVALMLGFYFSINSFEWCMIIFAISIVWMAEIFNTAIEYLTDFVSPEFNHIAGKVKDIAAAGALVAALTSAIIGVIIFYPKIF